MEQFILIQMSPDDFFNRMDEKLSELKSLKKTAESEDRLIDRPELKRKTNIRSDVTVISFERRGIFNPIHLGRRVFYRESEVNEALLKLQKVG